MSAFPPHVAGPLNSQRLGRTSVVRRAEQWWLVGGGGAVLATDPAFTGQMDRFAAALAAADQAVAGLRGRMEAKPPSGSGGR